MSGSSSRSKPKASEVAAETRRNYIPMIRRNYSHLYRLFSILYEQPLCHLHLHDMPRLCSRAPSFYVRGGDPAMMTIEWSANLTAQMGETVGVPLICAANDKRPGGDWETGVVGYEERLCRRSTLSYSLANQLPGSSKQPNNYPIPVEGGIFSEDVVVFRGPHDRYEKLPPEEWGVLPVCSVPPVRWPKLKQNGTKYSFAEERDMVKNKLRAALHICVYRGYVNVVIGDFGLGNSFRNPPREMAELWREVLLWDAELRGRIQAVAFVFEDPRQSTTQMIQDDMAKKSRKDSGGSSSSRDKGSHDRKARSREGASTAHASAYSSSSSSSYYSSNPSPPSSSSSSASSYATPTSSEEPPRVYSDMEIFSFTFSDEEIQRVPTQPDPRYELGTLMSPM